MMGGFLVVPLFAGACNTLSGSRAADRVFSDASQKTLLRSVAKRISLAGPQRLRYVYTDGSCGERSLPERSPRWFARWAPHPFHPAAGARRPRFGGLSLLSCYYDGFAAPPSAPMPRRCRPATRKSPTSRRPPAAPPGCFVAGIHNVKHDWPGLIVEDGNAFPTENDGRAGGGAARRRLSESSADSLVQAHQRRQ